METVLEFKKNFLCVLDETQSSSGNGRLISTKSWYPIRKAHRAEVQTLCKRPVKCVSSSEGIYVDEEGNVFQLRDKGETKPIAVDNLPALEKTELEVLLEASLKNGRPNEKNGGPKRLMKRNRSNDRKHAKRQSDSKKYETPEQAPVAVEMNGASSDVAALGRLQGLNLHQKLAEVRRRIGYIQKRGHNERFNYSYVTAADIAGAVGDLLSQLGVVVVPSLESISYEPVRISNGQVERVAHVVMTYRFTDVDTGEAVTVKVPGEGLDAGDKAPYKAMTGALKYALLQSFLLATGDDAEEERSIPSGNGTHRERTSDGTVTAEEASELRQLIEDTGTELERVLAYYKVAALEEMTESAYRRAVEVLNRKLAKQGNQETVHAQD